MKAIIFVLLCMISIQLSAQQWTKNLPKDKSKKELNYYDYQNAFYSYWDSYNLDRNGYYMEDGIKKKAIGWKQFKRWEWSMKGQVDIETGQFPQKSTQNIYNEYLKSQPGKSKARIANWSNLGPNSSDGGYAGIGRLEAVAFHPTDNNTYWVGAPSGGLWRTTDNGNSWICLTNDNNVLGVSDIIIPPDYEVSHTIYIATGDRDASHNYSIGILKSTDSGATWNTTDRSYGIGDSQLVYRIIMDPNDNQTILAATSDGLFKTTNGGATWDNNISGTKFVDLEAKPTDFNTLYASTSDGYIHVTTDGGANWTISNNYSGSRIDLAVTPANNNYVYAIVCNNNGGLESILQSANSGASFSMVYNGNIANHNLLGWEPDGSDQDGQGSYDLCIAVSPTDANKVIIGGINTWHSTNGGTTFSLLTSWSGTENGAQHIHADQHMLNYRSNGDLFLCNDGGIYLSTNNGATFTDKTNGIIISQMYKIGVSQLSSGEILNGLQDNGSKLLSGGVWTDVTGGDAMECIIDYTNNNIQYAASENGTIFRTTNHWGDTNTITPFDAGTGAWVTPYLIHPTDHNTLYAGYSDVWKTTDKGDNWVKISTIDTDDLLESMAISSDGGTLYVADDNTIWKSTNDGGSWTNIYNNLPFNSILSIAIKDGNPDVVWVTLGGYDNNGVYESTDGGASWSNISAGLPNLPVYTIVQNKQASETNHLYVGTQIGVFHKKGQDNWTLYIDGLPNVRIGELEIYYDNVPSQSKLRAGTFGRGLWESALELVAIVKPLVVTTPTTMISSTSTEVGGNLINEGASTVTEKGIVWSLNQNPTTNDTKIIDASTSTGVYSASITGLTQNTTYHYRAYAVNNNGTSYGNDISLKTQCDGILNFPFNEGFEGGTIPNCWSYEGGNWEYTDGGNATNGNNPSAAHGGAFNPLFFNENSGGITSKLVTPPLDFGNGTVATLSFWHTQTKFNNDQDILKVYYKTSFNSTWTLLATYSTDFPSWTEESISLPNISNNYYIAFEANLNYGNGVTIDDIKIISNTTLSVIELASISNNKLILFPNPTTKLITIVGNAQELEILKIVNILGQEISLVKNYISRQNGKVELNISSFPSGIYFLKTLSQTSVIYKE